jgi:TonB family protein
VFDVTPKVMPKKTTDRMFAGRVWVDDQDLQIVKSKGKGVPETKNNKFPIVETYRQQVDGKYWFPVYAYADDDIIFENGTDLRIRMRVKYTDYVVGHAKVKITEVGQAPEDTKPQPQSTPTRQPEAQPKTPAPTKPTGTVDTSADEYAPSDMGILNSRAMDLPRPAYPAEAKKDHITGQVQVKIIVDETGKVIFAEAQSGPEPLRAAAVEAAKRARFKPLVEADVKLKFFGILTFDFNE